MSDEPIILSKERADRSGDCREWTVLDALKETVREIEEGEVDPDMLFLIMREKPNENRCHYTYRSAGVTHVEAVGLVYKGLVSIEAEGREW